MEFLVQIRVDLPPEMPDSERDALIQAERTRGRELIASDHLKAIWRVPGGLRNVGIWEARDAAELDRLIASLPLFEWFSAKVTPLAPHPLSQPDAD